MIPLGLGDALLAYAGGLAVLVLLVWLAGAALRSRSERRQRRRLNQCMFCGTIYERPAGEPLPRCPQCAQPNERTPPSGI